MTADDVRRAAWAMPLSSSPALRPRDTARNNALVLRDALEESGFKAAPAHDEE